MANSGTGSRPFLNFTFAFNYAVGRLNVEGYHVLNLFIHILASLVLFEIVRRTLARAAVARFFQPRPPFSPNISANDAVKDQSAVNSGLSSSECILLAMFAAMLWAVHPLQTEAVTYISERAESLMGLFYLLTLYCFIRSVDDRDQQWQWLRISILICILGALVKETIITAPLMVFLYDRTFVAGSFREAWRRRWGYYLALATVWILLACLSVHINKRSVGFGIGVSGLDYGLTSCRSVVRYLALAFWPHPLVFDYGVNISHHLAEVMPEAVFLTTLCAGTIVALRYQPVLGFLAGWFFIILAPTSSIVPLTGQPMAEHRVYLSLAAIIVLIVLVLFRLFGKQSFVLFSVLTVALGWLSAQRNRDYRSEMSIWTDTVAKCPESARAVTSLGMVLSNYPDRVPEAIDRLKQALHLAPDYAEAHLDLGAVLSRIPGRMPEAISEYRAALRIDPSLALAHFNLAKALAHEPGHLTEAVAEYLAALRSEPLFPEAYNRLGLLFMEVPGHTQEAITEFEMATRIEPDYVDAHCNLGAALFQVPGRSSDAITEFERALKIQPDLAKAEDGLGCALENIPGQMPAAIAHFQAALRIDPNYVVAHNNLGCALADLPGQKMEAIAHFRSAIKIDPNFADAHNNLGLLLSGIPDQIPEAIAEYEAALRINPHLELVRQRLSQLRAATHIRN